MSGYVLGNFFIYAVINAFTPGPGNILALNTTTNYGLRKGRPLFLGIFAGYYVVQTACSIFVYGVSTFLPSVLGWMKYIGAAYILWLAVHIVLSRPEEGKTEKSASFFKGFLLQLINVKIYLFGITALTGYVTDYSNTFSILFFFGLLIASMGTIATASWIGMGMLIQRAYRKHYRIINVVLALSLLECIYSMIK